MRITDIKDISMPVDIDSRLEDKKNILAISVSLAAGLAWKDKVLSFYEIIANELLELFDNNLLSEISLKKINKNYVRIPIDNNVIYFNRNNMFLNSYEEMNIEEWINQELLIVENKKLPQYLTSDEKEKLFENMTPEEINLINKNYSRQELNTNRFGLNLIKNDENQLINLLTKNNYFSLSIYDYVKVIAAGKYEYEINSSDKNIKVFRNTYNNYILELGSHVSKAIENYLNSK